KLTKSAGLFGGCEAHTILLNYRDFSVISGFFDRSALDLFAMQNLCLDKLIRLSRVVGIELSNGVVPATIRVSGDGMLNAAILLWLPVQPFAPGEVRSMIGD